MSLARACLGLATAGALLATAAVASAAPAISGSEGAWWRSGPGSAYRVTGTAPGGSLEWSLKRATKVVKTGKGPSPLAVPLGEVGPGAYVLSARQTFQYGSPTSFANRSFRVDTAAPRVTSAAVSPQLVQFGAKAVLTFACAEPAGPAPQSGIARCEASAAGAGLKSGGGVPTNRLGDVGVTIAVADVAGNTGGGSVGYKVIDTVPPTAPLGLGPIATSANPRPRFTWRAATDAGIGGTGIDRYVLKIDARPPVTVPGDRTTYDLPAGASLPDGSHAWTVTAVDRGGNATPSPSTAFAIDRTAPPAPAITGGPSGPTNDRTPSFTWSGIPGGKFGWSLGSGAAVLQKGAGPAGSVRLAAIKADGAYTFSIAQTNPLGVTGTAAVRAFALDTVAPGRAPEVFGRPLSPSVIPNPAFAWTPGDPGVRYRWRVLAGGGGVVRGPGIVESTQLRIAPLAAGGYRFVVAQIDAAGNVGPESSPVDFVISEPPPPPAPRATRKPLADRLRATTPATRFPGRLSPKAGARIRALEPMLAWKPAGPAQLFNVQIFRVNGKRLTKIHSAFPRAARYRVPAGVLRPGNRFSWQVWRYRGPETGYARSPDGISYFDQLTPKKPGRLILPAELLAGRRLPLRWTPAPRAERYQVTLMRGEKRVFRAVSQSPSAVVPAARLAQTGRYQIVVKRSVGSGDDRRFAAAVWAGRAVELTAAPS